MALSVIIDPAYLNSLLIVWGCEAPYGTLQLSTS